MAVSWKASRLFLLLCLGLVLYLFLWILSPFLTPILLAIVTVTLFYPSYANVDRKLRHKPNLSSFFMCVFITFLIIIPTFLLAVTLSNEIQRAFSDYQTSVQEGTFHIEGSERLVAGWNKIRSVLGLKQMDFHSGMEAAIREIGLFLVQNSSVILAGFAHLVADFFIMIFTLFFLFRDGKTFLHEIMGLMPLSRAHTNRMVDRFKQTIFATFFGSFVNATVQGISVGLLLWIFQFQNALLWGMLTAITSLVPLVGSGLVWVPATIYLFLRGFWGRALILAIYGAVGIPMLDNILRPLVIKKTSEDLHTLLIFFGILGGIWVFGFPGLILGPVIVAFTVTILDMVKLEFRQEAE
ncbi:MAG TPA: AI-2E family transporter [Acidobacteriota bacterium]|jgi:predicted PurR-regulated permease PerM